MTRSDLESLRTFVKHHPNRPLLTHLNADTSWLISFPFPDSMTDKKKRRYYHLLLDPWLTGTNVVGFTWFISIAHTTAPTFTSVQEVRQLILDIERAAGILETSDDGEPDCVCVTFVGPDHCNEHTLSQLHLSTPVISTVPAIARIKSFKHFDESVYSIMPDLNLDTPENLWRETSLTSSHHPSIPTWLKIGRLPSDGTYPHLHWATLLAWSPSHAPLGRSDSTAETFLYSPHGIRCKRLKDVSWATDPKKGSLLCNMHGLAPAWSPQEVNLGVQNGYTLSKMLKAKYWVPTHDEEPTYTGVIGWMQTKIQKTLQDVVRESDEIPIEVELEKAGTTMRELRNGETFCLA